MENEELNNEIFGIHIKEIPTNKNAINGEPDIISCLINFTINRKEEKIKFNQSTIGISTKKALETASSRVVSKLIKKGVFKN